MDVEHGPGGGHLGRLPARRHIEKMSQGKTLGYILTGIGAIIFLLGVVWALGGSIETQGARILADLRYTGAVLVVAGELPAGLPAPVEASSPGRRAAMPAAGGRASDASHRLAFSR